MFLLFTQFHILFEKQKINIEILSKSQFKKLKIENRIFNFHFKTWISIIDLFSHIQNLSRDLDIKVNWKLEWKSIFNQNTQLKIKWTFYTRTPHTHRVHRFDAHVYRKCHPICSLKLKWKSTYLHNSIFNSKLKIEKW